MIHKYFKNKNIHYLDQIKKTFKLEKQLAFINIFYKLAELSLKRICIISIIL